MVELAEDNTEGTEKEVDDAEDKCTIEVETLAHGLKG